MAEPIHEFEIEYCVPCNYIEIMKGHLTTILTGYGPVTKSVKLVMSSWGTFEVKLDGEMIYSKWALGQRFPKPGELEAILESRLGPPLIGYEDHEPSKVDEMGRQVLPAGFWEKTVAMRKGDLETAKDVKHINTEEAAGYKAFST